MLLNRFLYGCKWSVCCLAFLISPMLYAATNINDYFVEVWDSRDGLPHNSVNAIAQTDDGYLWFATWEGVARFNGLKFEVFDRDNKTGIIDSGIHALTPANGNRLWVAGGRGGVTLRENYNWSPQKSTYSMVNDLLVDDQSNIWIATENAGVFYREKLKDGLYANDLPILSAGASHLAKTKSGLIYVASKSGFYRVSRNGAEKIRIPDLADDLRIYYLSVDRNDDVLIGTAKGAYRYDGNVFVSLSADLSRTPISVVEEDNEGHLWLGTLDQGLARVTPDGVDYIDTDSGLPNNRVISWLQDNEGSIWVGTNGGLLRLRNVPFNNYSIKDGLAGNFVRTLLDIPGDRFLIGSDEGLSLLEDGKVLPASNQSAAQLSILSLANSSDNSVLVGTKRSGVYKWKSGSMTPLFSRGKSGLPSNDVRSVLEDSKGRIWVGTVDGLVMYRQDGTSKLFQEQNSSLPDNYVIALSEDKRGRVWIGTAEGVAVYDRRNRMLPIDIFSFEGAQYVFGFYIEPGFVWMATDRGLLRYDTFAKEISGVGRPNGMPIDKLFQIVYDRMGSFWLSSNRGVWKIGYVDAHRVASGELNTITFEHFDNEDGMGSNQANGGSTPAAVSSNTGLIGFATANGASFIVPKALKLLYQYNVPVVIESVGVNGSSIDPQNEHVLEAGTNRIRIDFVGLSYIMPQRLQYKTKLIGFDDEWDYQGAKTVSEYTNLPPGHYEFHVSTRYPYGQWNESSTVYNFEIKPFFWQRSDVQMLSLVALIAAIGALFYWRGNSIKRRQADLAEQIHVKTEALREQSEKFERLSKEDSLTGLYNRRAFDEKVRREFILSIQGLAKLNLAIIDIDNFKQVNDRFSHLVGDEIIQLMANYLNDSISSPNVVARWGGEEFTLLIHGTEEAARDICESLLMGVRELHCPQLNNEFSLTISIGLANALGCYDYQGLLKRADQALYEAKNSGRDRLEQYQEFRM